MPAPQYGLTGLGTMGRNLALNIADSGFELAVHNRSADRMHAFVDDAGDLADRLTRAETLADLVAAIARPRTIIMMVPAGDAVDGLIEALVPLLEDGDTLVDAGNADFNETRRRDAALAGSGVNFVGMGVSGGAEGARNGPSIMVGGPEASWQALRPMIRAIAATYQGDPCADRVGPDGAGHFVKTVHNGIEYADMQMIADIYGLLRDGRGTPAAEAAKLFDCWNAGPLESYLIEITAKVLAATDPDTGAPMMDVIRDRAGQKGTGRWTLIEALKLGQSASVIEAAVAARSWSAGDDLRADVAKVFGGVSGPGIDLSDEVLEQALLTAKIVAYAQGMSLLSAASDAFDWQVDLSRVAQIWRAGCIIRSALLDQIAAAFDGGLPHQNLLLADGFTPLIQTGLPALRDTVSQAARAGSPVPALAAALSYIETLRFARGTAELIQGQRDFFGEHGFERRDRPGTGFHGPWGAPGG